jgi:Protein of unknown function (DUF4239)
MLTLAQNIMILVGTMVASLLLLRFLDRFWPFHERHIENDLIGWQLNVLGTTYAVVLGFMLYTAWTDYGAAELNVNLEANSLRNVFRLAEGLPQPQRAQLEMLSRDYADAAIQQDWPAMAHGLIPEATHKVNESMWKTVMSVKANSASEGVTQDHAISELSALTSHRRTRLLQCVSSLPAIFWGVLLTGGTLTLVSAAIFGSSKAKVHAYMVFSITVLVTLVMLAIADVNRPFSGWVHVSDYPFVRAQENLREAQ